MALTQDVYKIQEEYRSRDIRKSDIALGWKQGFSDIRMLLVYAYGAFRDYDYYRPDSLVPEDAEAFYANRTCLLYTSCIGQGVCGGYHAGNICEIFWIIVRLPAPWKSAELPLYDCR